MPQMLPYCTCLWLVLQSSGEVIFGDGLAIEVPKENKWPPLYSDQRERQTKTGSMMGTLLLHTYNYGFSVLSITPALDPVCMECWFDTRERDCDCWLVLFGYPRLTCCDCYGGRSWCRCQGGSQGVFSKRLRGWRGPSQWDQAWLQVHLKGTTTASKRERPDGLMGLG